jgi:hypothetical protein
MAFSEGGRPGLLARNRHPAAQELPKKPCAALDGGRGKSFRATARKAVEGGARNDMLESETDAAANSD